MSERRHKQSGWTFAQKTIAGTPSGILYANGPDNTKTRSLVAHRAGRNITDIWGSVRFGEGLAAPFVLFQSVGAQAG